MMEIQTQNRIIDLSSGQKRLYTIEQMLLLKETYHIYFEINFKFLNIRQFQSAINQIIRSHETLRTIFIMKDGVPKQKILESYQLEIKVHDILKTDTEQARLIKDKTMREPFELDKKPPYRINIIRFNTGEIKILTTCHHILIDGRSIHLLAINFFTSYIRFSMQQTQTENQHLQFSDFVKREQEFIQSYEGRTSKEYWIKKLDGSNSNVALTAHNISSGSKIGKGKHFHFSISKELTKDLYKLAGEQNCSFFNIFSTVFASLIYRYSNQHDFNIGTIYHNRESEEFKKTIGFFVNTTVLRYQITDDETFESFSKKSSLLIDEAQQHGKLPYAEIISDPAFRKNNPVSLFNICLVQETALEFPALKNMGVSISLEAPDGSVPGTAKFDLTMMYAISNGEVSGNIEYNSEIFDNNFIHHFVCNLQCLIKSIVANPTARLSEFEYFRKENESRYIRKTIFPNNHQLLHRFFEEMAIRKPFHTCLCDHTRNLNFAEVNQLANNWSHYLIDNGVQINDRIGICAERSIEAIVAMIAILKAGATYVPLDLEFPKERLEYIIKDAGINIILSDGKCPFDLKLPNGKIILFSNIPLNNNEHAPELNIQSDDGAYCIYTSGSTGKPKGVLVNHSGIVNYMNWKITEFPPETNDKILHKTIMGFDSSIGEIWYPLCTGTSLFIAKDGGHKEISYLIDTIKEQKITLLKAVPSLLSLLVKHNDWKECKSLRLIISAGEPLSTKLANELQESTHSKVANFYGPTETTVSASSYTVQSTETTLHVPIGLPIANTEVMVLDQFKKTVPKGVAGELYITGAGVARYLNNNLDQERYQLLKNNEGKNSRFYKTGDIVVMNENGTLNFVGRNDQQIKWNGNRIELNEIDSILSKHPFIETSCTVLWKLENNPAKLISFYTSTADTDEATLRKFLEDKLPLSFTPLHFIKLNKLPQLDNQKIDRRYLETFKIDFEKRFLLSPTNQTEHIIFEALSETLLNHEISTDDNFYSIGLDSLSLMSILEKLSNKLPKQISFKHLFQFPTIKSLAAYINNENDDNRKSDAIWRRELSVPLKINNTTNIPHPKQGSVLLTGATGLLGTSLLYDLCNEFPGRKIICLVRANNDHEAKIRLAQSLNKYGIDTSSISADVSIVAGDFTKNNLGIAEEQFLKLLLEVSEVVHNGALVNHALNYESLKESNVTCLQHIFSFCSSGILKKLHFISTLGVFDKSKTTFFSEEIIQELYPDNLSGYSQSKWVAENLVFQAGMQGIPTAIYRPGLMSGRSGSGIVDTEKYWIILFIKAAIRHKIFPRESISSIRILPVDVVSSSIAKLIKLNNQNKPIFNITHPQSLESKLILKELKELYPYIQAIPFQDWKNTIRQSIHPEDIILAHILPDLLSEEMIAPLQINYNNTKNTFNGFEALTELHSPVSILRQTLNYLEQKSHIASKSQTLINAELL